MVTTTANHYGMQHRIPTDPSLGRDDIAEQHRIKIQRMSVAAIPSDSEESVDLK